MIKKIFVHVLRSLLGLVFIYSAVSKLFPAEPFELFIFGQSFLSWDVTTIVARLIIAFELFLGLFLLINIYTKRIIQLTLILLAGFTVYLAYLAVFQPDLSNCNCFGAHFEISPAESIIKNAVLILASVFLLYSNRAFSFRFKKIVLIIGILSSLALPPVISPPDQFVVGESDNSITYEFDYDRLGTFEYKGQEYNLKEGKVILAFLSLKCKFCKLAAQKFTIIDDKYKGEIPIFYVLYGRQENVGAFLEESNSKEFPYKVFETDTFFMMSGRRIPSIQLIEDGTVSILLNYRSLDEEKLLRFMSDDTK